MRNRKSQAPGCQVSGAAGAAAAAQPSQPLQRGARRPADAVATGLPCPRKRKQLRGGAG